MIPNTSNVLKLQTTTTLRQGATVTSKAAKPSKAAEQPRGNSVFKGEPEKVLAARVAKVAGADDSSTFRSGMSRAEVREKVRSIRDAARARKSR